MSGIKVLALAIGMLAASASVSPVQAQGVVPGGWAGEIGYRALDHERDAVSFGFGYGPYHSGYGYGYGSPYSAGMPGAWPVAAPATSPALTTNGLLPLAGAFDREFRPRRRGR